MGSSAAEMAADIGGTRLDLQTRTTELMPTAGTNFLAFRSSALVRRSTLDAGRRTHFRERQKRFAPFKNSRAFPA
ncbi:hypothetical protein ASD02_10710 [Ensifer sp. Root1252]|nr:hypothetical protein ASD02_10710 [Ensifer sp. Root1252]KQW67320.1 hypothetical protein ASD03_10625 [Ensifer sp. Root127]KRC74614.1 hypothetical protein ASE32_06795 [Ensifer sp. Root231]KRC94700.1 hypothetical protein ASE47_07785 [Ensifer sp. Root258]